MLNFMLNGMPCMDKMKAKSKKRFEDTIYFWDMLNILLARFKITGLPDNIPPEYVELSLIFNGTVGFGEADGEVWAVSGGYHGDVKGYLPDSYVGTIPNVTTIDGKVGTDVIVGWNNATHTPDLDLILYANRFTELDTSEDLNVLFTRLLRIPKVKDSKEKKAVEEAIDNLLDGKRSAMVSNNIGRQLLGETDGIDFLELADVKDVDKLQYLVQFREALWKRFFQKYGQGMQTNIKQAQVSVDEFHGSDAVSMIYTLQCLKYRQEMAEKLNARFGWNVQYELSDCWQDSYDEAIEEATGETYTDDDNTGAEPDTEPEKESDDNGNTDDE